MSAFLTPVPLPVRDAPTASTSSSRTSHPPRQYHSRRVMHATLAAPTPSPTTPPRPEQGIVHNMHTPDQFDALLAQARQSNSLVVIDFLAKWCRKCTYLLPRFRKLARQYNHDVFVSVDVNAVARLPREFDVRAMPTFVVLRNGQRVDTLVGGAAPAVVAEQLERLLQTHATTQ